MYANINVVYRVSASSKNNNNQNKEKGKEKKYPTDTYSR